MGKAFGITVAAASLATGVLTWHLAPVVEGALARPAMMDASTVEDTADIGDTVYYPGCRAARAAGAAPIHRGSPGYRAEMDGDGDGIACEDYAGGGSSSGWFSRRGDRPAARVSSGSRRRAR